MEPKKRKPLNFTKKEIEELTFILQHSPKILTKKQLKVIQKYLEKLE